MKIKWLSLTLSISWWAPANKKLTLDNRYLKAHFILEEAHNISGKMYEYKVFRNLWSLILTFSSSASGVVSSWYESPLPLRLGAPHTALRKARATSEQRPHCRPPLRLPASSTVSSLPLPSLQHATAFIMTRYTAQ